VALLAGAHAPVTRRDLRERERDRARGLRVASFSATALPPEPLRPAHLSPALLGLASPALHTQT